MSKKPQPTANPWMAPTEPPVAREPEPTSVPAEPMQRTPTAPVRGMVEPIPGAGLPTWEPDPAGGIPPWWWVPCHGGAGSTTLAEVVGGADAGKYGWPRYPDGIQPGVILVARTHAAGLQAAQRASRQWASGAVGQVRLLGLVAVADAPGRLPRPLQQWLKLVTGGLPRVWAVPWHEPWRLGEPRELGTAPKQVAKLAQQLRMAFGRVGEASR